jgi:hypothetical protein
MINNARDFRSKYKKNEKDQLLIKDLIYELLKTHLNIILTSSFRGVS